MVYLYPELRREGEEREMGLGHGEAQTLGDDAIVVGVGVRDHIVATPSVRMTLFAGHCYGYLLLDPKVKGVVMVEYEPGVQSRRGWVE